MLNEIIVLDGCENNKYKIDILICTCVETRSSN